MKEVTVLLENLMHNKYAWAVLSIIAIVSQVKNKEKKQISYILKNYSLIRSRNKKFEKLSFNYDGKSIDNICVSRFTIWNSGNRTLNNSDMVKSKELMIRASENVRILDVSIIKETETTNNFIVELIDERTATITFDYIDKNDGIVLQIIHDGIEDSLDLSAKIKGGEKIKNVLNTKQNYIDKINTEIMIKFFNLLYVVLLLFLFVMALLNTISIWNYDLQKFLYFPKDYSTIEKAALKKAIAWLSIILWLYWFFMAFLVFSKLKRLYMFGVPKKLKQYSNFKN